MRVSAELNELSMLMLVACDQAYAGNALTVGEELAEYPDSRPEQSWPLPYSVAGNGFVVVESIEIPQTGFKCVIYKSVASNELIVALAGTDGPNAKDWGINLTLGWGQWNGFTPEVAGRTQVFRVLDSLRDAGALNSDTRVHFTGQSLGGALAEFAAYEASLRYPLLASRSTLTTFNGLGGRTALENYGKYSSASLAAFKVSMAAHYRVTNDLVSLLGGGHIGGPVFELPFRSQTMRNGQPLLLDPIAAHRIEAGFYRSFFLQGVSSPLFMQARSDTTAPIPSETIQPFAAQIIALFNKGLVTEESAKYRIVAALIFGLNHAARDRDIDLLFRPMLEAALKSDLRESFTFLERQGIAIASNLTTAELRGAANDLKAYAVRNLTTALVIEALADPKTATGVDLDRLKALVEPFEYPLPADLESRFYLDYTPLQRTYRVAAGVALINPPSSMTAEERELLRQLEIDPHEIERVMFGEVDWEKGLLTALRNTHQNVLDRNKAEALGLYSRILADTVRQVSEAELQRMNNEAEAASEPVNKFETLAEA
jgi:hypothetical protein